MRETGLRTKQAKKASIETIQKGTINTLLNSETWQAKIGNFLQFKGYFKQIRQFDSCLLKHQQIE
jgi:hypothetical protein